MIKAPNSDLEQSTMLTDQEIGELWDSGVSSGKGAFQTADAIISEAKRRSSAPRTRQEDDSEL